MVANPLVQDLAGGRIDDVQEREIYCAFDPVISGVDGVARQQEEIRAGRLELVALFGQQLTDQIPPACALVALDLFEICLRQHEPGAVHAAVTQALGDPFVDDPVVNDRTGPRDAADDPDGLHVVLPEEMCWPFVVAFGRCCGVESSASGSPRRLILSQAISAPPCAGSRS